MANRRSKRKKINSSDAETKQSDKEESPDHLSVSSQSSNRSRGSVARRTSHSGIGSRYEVLIRPIIEG